MANDNGDLIASLLQGLQNTDPRLYQILLLLTADVSDLRTTVIPIEVQKVLDVINTPLPLPGTILTFNYQFFPTFIRFSWRNDNPAVIKQAEIRFLHRPNLLWEEGTFVVRTASTIIDINPLPAGDYLPTITPLNADGVIGGFTGIAFTIPPITAPVISPRVIDNNVLLNWNAPPSTFLIDHYNIYKNGVLTGSQGGTFFSSFESISGSYTYSVEAVDIAGNVGSRGSVTVNVNEPPDFILFDTFVSLFGGAKTNVLLESSGKLLCCINLTETWTTHHTLRGWTNIQDQVNAGYNIYGEPFALIGSYVEIIDYGAVFNELIVNFDWSVDILVGNVAVTIATEASVDGSSWTAPQGGKSVFIPTLRYLRITILFTPTDDKSAIEFYNLRVFLNTKSVLTSGVVSAKIIDNTPATASTHLGGTYVPFVKPYKSVNSITLTTNSQQPVTAIYDLIGVPNPDGFKVFTFDSAGNRIDQVVSWKVRGLI